jgi:ABC-2 type transport system permease protein
MRKIWVIANREYQAAVRTKSFLISVVVLPLLMGGSGLVQVLLKDFRDTREQHYVVVDRTSGEKLVDRLKQAAVLHNEKTKPPFDVQQEEPRRGDAQAMKEQRLDLSERVRRREILGFLEIGPEVFQTASEPGAEQAAIRYQSNSPTNQDFSQWADAVINEAVHNQRAAKLGVSPEQLKATLQPVPLLSKGLSKRNARGEIEDTPEDRIASFLVPAGLMMLMFIIVLVGATPLMQGVVEEKMQRIAEVLLGSVQPFELMFGKLLGITGVSLTLAAIYLSGAFWAAHHYGFAEMFSVPLIAWFILFQTLAVMMYGSLFIAVGAACTDLRETQNLMWPVMMVAMFPMFVLVNVIREPSSSFALGASLFPFATPTLMVARMAVPPGVPLWQPVIGVGLVVATTLACVYAAGRIFRVGILMQGKGARLADLFRWVVSG